MAKETNNILFLGHICHDLTPDGVVLGGSVAYAAFLAKKMDWQPTIITSVGKDFQFFDKIKKAKIPLINIESVQTTCFENIETPNGRQQTLHHRAASIFPENIPSEFQKTDVVFFAPIADEIDFKNISLFPNSLKVATIQGWLRQWNHTGIVHPKTINWKNLKGIDIIICSEEDIANLPNALDHLKNNCPIVLLTKGENGVILFQRKNKIKTTRHFPAFPTKAVDTTGAGDSFATGFALSYASTNDMEYAVNFGQAAASLVVERRGVVVPEREEILRRVTMIL